jgi:hypothetical protein
LVAFETHITYDAADATALMMLLQSCCCSSINDAAAAATNITTTSTTKIVSLLALNATPTFRYHYVSST